MLCLLLVQYERTAAAVYEAEDSVDTLIDLLQIYRDKGADIFTNTCMLLGIMGFDDSRRSVSFCHLLMPQYNLAMSSFLKMQALLSWRTLTVVFYCVNCKMPCVSLMFLLHSYNVSCTLQFPHMMFGVLLIFRIQHFVSSAVSFCTPSLSECCIDQHCRENHVALLATKTFFFAVSLFVIVDRNKLCSQNQRVFPLGLCNCKGYKFWTKYEDDQICETHWHCGHQ